jgi:3-oxoacyl-[acyl-carrier protein] reductase
MQLKNVLIMGGSKGIGKAIALRAAKDFDNVIINYVNSKDKAEETIYKITNEEKKKAKALYTDITNEKNIQGVMKEIENEYGHLNALVNCAGVMIDNPIENIDYNEWQKVLSINLSGVFLSIKYALPLLKKANTTRRIVNISSQAAYTGSAGHSHYVSAKAGVLGLTYSLAKELGPLNICVNVVSPGRINTEMIKEHMDRRMEEWLRSTPLNRFGEPEEVANVVAFLLSDQSSYITGANINVNGGMLMG